MNAVLGNQELIRKIRLPQAVFPLSVVGSNLVNFVLSVVPLLGVMLVIGHPVTPALFFLPVAAVLLCSFAAGLTLIFSSATVFFRDVRHLTEVLLQILFYLTPVLYSPEQIGQGNSAAAWWLPAFRGVLEANPLTYLLPLVRDPVYRGTLPPLETIGAAAAWAAGSLVAGYLVFRKLEPRHIHHF
jgi:ABC-type polysaccharide/polyol phosphate export permease